MTDNTERCGNCGTENPVGQDFCIKCHQPLTASAEEGIRENLDAQDGGGLFGRDGSLGTNVGLDVGVMGGGSGLPPNDLGDTSADDPMRHGGQPPRRS